MKNRSEKRAAANFLRGPQKCVKCDFFELCYEKQKKMLEIRANHKPGKLPPKEARENLPTEICEYHESRQEIGKFYPKYDVITNDSTDSQHK